MKVYEVGIFKEKIEILAYSVSYSEKNLVFSDEKGKEIANFNCWDYWLCKKEL